MHSSPESSHCSNNIHSACQCSSQAWLCAGMQGVSASTLQAGLPWALLCPEKRKARVAAPLPSFQTLEAHVRSADAMWSPVCVLAIQADSICCDACMLTLLAARIK